MSLRRILFWLHLSAGLLAGSVIAVMAFTGSTLAFQKEIVAWVEREARIVTDPAGVPPLSVDEVLRLVRVDRPDLRPSSIVVLPDPKAAWMLTMGREGVYFINPYTGRSVPAPAVRVRAFFRAMEAWHRNLGRMGDQRIWGKSINDACSVAFLFLAVSGLFLWWPRGGFFRGWRAGSRFNFQLRGKSRDWNWHNVIGFWSAPILIVLTLTALPLSYHWASDLIYKLTGTEAPGGGRTGLVDAAQVNFNPKAGAKSLGYQRLLDATEKEVPGWNQITLRLAGNPRGEGEETRGGNEQPRKTEHRKVEPVTFTVREAGSWPRPATLTLIYDPTTAELLRRENFSDQNVGRRIRFWTRFLHTGEALGLGGQLIAGAVSFGVLFLVATGFSLAVRRFWARG